MPSAMGHFRKAGMDWMKRYDRENLQSWLIPPIALVILLMVGGCVKTKLDSSYSCTESSSEEEKAIYKKLLDLKLATTKEIECSPEHVDGRRCEQSGTSIKVVCPDGRVLVGISLGACYEPDK